MSMYSISTIGKTVKHYITFGLICAAFGMYVGSCSTKASPTRNSSKFQSAGEMTAETLGSRHAASFPSTPAALFDAYTKEPASQSVGERRAGLEYRLD